MKLATNANKLVELSVLGVITHPIAPRAEYHITGITGEPRVLPGMGGICYSHRVGDGCVDVVGDHVEPGVSTSNFNRDFGAKAAQAGYNTYACIGNDATVVTGSARGAKGVVVGKHGGIEHVLIDFPPRTMRQLVVGDRVQVRARGVGLELTGIDGVQLFNCSPRLLDRLGLSRRRGKLRCPVTHVVPAKIMGSGLGKSSAHTGDYDIQMFDADVVADHGLATLRFGDVVAIQDADSTFGRVFKTGAVTVGVVVHSVSVKAGHGPGVCTLLSSARGDIEPVVRADANLARILGLRKGLFAPSRRRTSKRTKRG
ncbi:MAG: DUF4438 domain-containing protein [Deltaproteobacteria bacterium]|jgi:hypothetical protein|nr:DUF4438 domain-containing protein [Deltaproteobacteria bacterium]MBW2535741.1 DUF4438 domain-containing protein [Deltaproteobacteria bacterium]